MSRPPTADPYVRLRALTQARIGLGRFGTGLPTRALLDFQLAHARARDALGQPIDIDALKGALGRRDCVTVASRAADRREYLRRPDLGRRLAPDHLERLEGGPFDVVFVIADGLSAQAAHKHGPALLEATLPRLAGWSVGPIVLARQARVALGDEIGGRLGARLVAMLIGERPGLTASDSLGVYLTWGPRVGRNDSERNCISNIRDGGLTCEAAADRLAQLARAAMRLQLTGVGLKADAAPEPTLRAAETPAGRVAAPGGAGPGPEPGAR